MWDVAGRPSTGPIILSSNEKKKNNFETMLVFFIFLILPEWTYNKA